MVVDGLKRCRVLSRLQVDGRKMMNGSKYFKSHFSVPASRVCVCLCLLVFSTVIPGARKMRIGI